MSVRRLLGEMDSREISEWMAYESVEPFGPWRDDVRAGVVAATVANVNRAKGAKPYMPTDFVLEFAPRKKVDEQAQVMAMYGQMQVIASVQNALVEEQAQRQGYTETAEETNGKHAEEAETA
jgi:hypothetical protein